MGEKFAQSRTKPIYKDTLNLLYLQNQAQLVTRNITRYVRPARIIIRLFFSNENEELVEILALLQITVLGDNGPEKLFHKELFRDSTSSENKI